MKTIEYPIKEMVSFEMDENKIWWLRYDKEKRRTLLPLFRGWGRKNKKGYMDFVIQVTHFCNKQNLTLEGKGCGMVSGRRIVHWGKKDVLGRPFLPPRYSFPTLLFPMTQTGCRFGIVWETVNHGTPYYGNPHYKKYIEDNNGECPLPLPEGIKWWEV